MDTATTCTILICVLALVSVPCSTDKSITEQVRLRRLLNGTMASTRVDGNIIFYEDGVINLNLDATKPLSVIQLLVANDSNSILQLQMNSLQEWTKKLYRKPYMVIHEPNTKVKFIWNSFDKKFWSLSVNVTTTEPVKPTKYNIVASKSMNDTDFMATYSITNAEIALPDLMVVRRYKRIGSKY